MTCEKCKYWTVDVSITKSRFGFCTLKKTERNDYCEFYKSKEDSTFVIRDY